MACTVTAEAFNFDGMYAHKPFALSSEIWVQVKVTFPQLTIDATVADTANNAFLMIENESFGWNQGLEIDYIGPDAELFANHVATLGTYNPFVPVANTQYLCEMHLKSNGPVTQYDWDFWVDGALVMDGTGFAHTGWQAIILGWLFGTDTPIEITYEDLRVGTTRHGSNLLADDFCSGDFATYDDVFAVAPNAFSFAGGAEPPAPSSRFFTDFPWRFIVTDLNTATLTFLDRLATGRNVTKTINQSTVISGVAPADNPEVNIAHTDGDPFLAYNNRLIYAFRREGGDPPWVVRAAGIIMQPNDEAGDSPVTRFTAFDPWMLLNHRPILNGDGELPRAAGLTYTGTRGDVIALELLEATIAAHGTVHIDHGQTSQYGGTIEATDILDIAFQQGLTVGEAWTQLCATDTIDIELVPIYDPFGRPGYTHELSIWNAQGATRRGAIMAWDMPSRSLVDVNRQIEGDAMANKVQFYAGKNVPATLQTNAASVAKFGQWWASQFFPGQNIKSAVELLAAAQALLRANGKQTMTLEPAPERSPFLFLDYDIGDSVPVYASRRLRDPIATLQRIHGITVDISDDGIETVRPLLLAETGVPAGGGT